MPVIGRAQLAVAPSFTGFQQEAEKQVRRSGPGIGSRLAAGIGTGLKRGAQVAGAAAGGVMTVALVKGFQRLTAIEEAEAKLRGLGNSAGDVEKIMTDALAAVRGTAFGMGEAATTAAGAVAAGIKPGQELEKYLRLTADAATIAGVSMEEMGSIINKTTTAGKVQADNLNQLADRGIPIFQWLAEEYKVSASELSEMVRKGEVDSATFRKVIEENIGGAALQSGATTQGAFKNLGAALGRVGANLLSGVFPHLQRLFVGLTDALSPLEDQAKVVGQALGVYVGRAVDWLIERLPSMIAWVGRMATGLSGLYDLVVKGDYSSKLRESFGWSEDSGPVDFLFRVRDGLIGIYDLVAKGDYSSKLRTAFGWSEDSGAVDFLFTVRDGVTGLFSAIRSGDPSKVLSTVSGTGDGLASTFQRLLPALQSFGAAMPTLARAGVNILAGALQFLGDHMDTIVRFLPAIIAGFLAYRAAAGVTAAATYRLQTAQVAMAPVLAYNSTLRVIATGLELAQARAQKQNTAATVANTAATAGRNRVETLGNLIAGRGVAVMVAQRAATIAATVATKASAAATWLLNAAMRANPIGIVITLITALVAGLVWFFTQTEIGQKIVQVAFRAIGAAAQWLWQNAIKPAFTFIAGIVQQVGQVISFLWTNYARPALAAIGAAFVRLGQTYRSIWTGYISPVFQLIGAIIRTLWEKVARPIFGFLGSRFLTLAKALMSAYITYMKVMFTAAGAIISWLWNNVAKPLFGFIQNRWREMALGARIIWTNVLRPMFTAVGDLVGRLWNSWIKPRLDAIKSGWSVMAAGLKTGYDRTIAPMFGTLRSAVQRVKDAFATAVDGISAAWDGLKEAAKKPVRFVIDTVINGLIRGFNGLAEKFGTDKMPEIKLPRGFAGGGVLPGFTPGRDVHRFFSRTGGRLDLSGGEAIMRPEWTRAVGGPAAVAAMNRAARLGQAFAGGGVFRPVTGGPANRHASGYPWATWAGDYPQPMGAPVVSWKDGIVALVKRLATSYGHHVRVNHDDGSSSLYAHLSKILVSAGQRIAGGQRLGLVGSTGNSTGPHLHFESMGGRFTLSKLKNAIGFGAQKVASMASELTDKLSGPIGRLKELTSSPIGQLARAAATRIRDGLLGLAKKQDAATDTGTGSQWSGARVGGLSAEQLNNASTIMDVAKRNGFGSRGAKIALMTAFQESTLRNIGYGDRDSVGLFQQRTPWGSRADRMNPARSAGMFFNGGQGGQPGLRSKNWRGLGLGQAAQAVQVSAFPYAYDKWAGQAQQLIDQSGKFDAGGLLQPGYTLAYNGTSKPEPVFTDDQWSALQQQPAGLSARETFRAVRDGTRAGYQGAELVGAGRLQAGPV